MTGRIDIKRVYEPAGAQDGFRVLVDRLWPRGLRKKALVHDDWAKEAAPSPALRQWFGHKPGHWQEFRRLYRAELRRSEPALRGLLKKAGRKRLTLLYAAKDAHYNHAQILADYLRRMKKAG